MRLKSSKKDRLSKKEKKMLGQIHVYTGNGKGKTTAAMGLAVRALGHGLNVKIIQFFKNSTGEKNILADFCCYSQFSYAHPRFSKNYEQNVKSQQFSFKDFWNTEIKDIEKQNYDLIVLDELGSLLYDKIADESEIIKFIKNKPENAELILTGRNIPKSIVDLSSYCTEMQEIKHPWKDLNLGARKGIEY